MKVSALVRLAGIGLPLAIATGCAGNQISNPSLQLSDPGNYTGDPSKNGLFH